MTDQSLRATSTRDVRSIIADYFSYVNAEDIAGITGLFAEDGEVVAPLSKPLVGREMIAAYYRRVYEMYPRHSDTVTNVMVDGKRAAVEIRFDGTSSDGREIHFLAVDVFECGDGHVQRLYTFFDSAQLLRDLGKL